MGGALFGTVRERSGKSWGAAGTGKNKVDIAGASTGGTKIAKRVARTAMISEN